MWSMSDRKTGEEGFPCRKHKNKHLKLRWSLMDGRLRGAAWGLNQTSFVSLLLLLSWPSISVAVQAGSWSYVRPASGGVPSLLPVFVRPSEASTCLISGSRPEIS